MEKSVFEKAFQEKLDKNFEKFNPYFDYQYKVFFELTTTVFQAVKCLILELPIASITMTNHILERLLKLALIYKMAGVGPIPPEQLTEVFSAAHNKYNHHVMASTIELCKKEGLITVAEKDILFNLVRNQIRNGFSHADMEKVLAEIPDIIHATQFSFSDPNERIPVSFNPKVIPTFQADALEKFAAANAENYFVAVFNLLRNIEGRLTAASI